MHTAAHLHRHLHQALPALRRPILHHAPPHTPQLRCPAPGCTKAYINPNGIEYHREKGTCVGAAGGILGALAG